MGKFGLSNRFFRSRKIWFFKGGHTKNTTRNKKLIRPAARLLATISIATGLAVGAVSGSFANDNTGRFNQSSGPAAKVTLKSQITSELAAYIQALSPPEKGTSNYSQYVDRINSMLGKLPGKLPIVLLDRDTIKDRLAAMGKEIDDREALKHVIQEYVRDVSGITLSDTNADDVGLFFATNSGFAFQFTHAESPERVAKGDDICVVMAGDPDRSREATLLHKLQFTPEIYGDALFKAGVRPILSREEILKITDYHELSHCFDNRHIQEVQKHLTSPGTRNLAHTMHKAEAFAEVNAMFLMMRDHYDPSLVERRADMRATYSYMVGPYIARQPGMPQQSSIMPGDYGGIYALDRVLRATAQKIRDLGPDKLNAMSIDDIIALSYALVDLYGLSEAEFSAITTFHGNLHHRTIVEEYAKDPDEHDFWRERKKLIDEYEARSLEAIARVIDTRNLDKPLAELIPQYEVAPPPDNSKPKPWDAPFTDQEHYFTLLGEAYYDLKLRMAQYGHNANGLQKAMAEIRDTLRPALSIASGDLGRSIRQRLAVLHRAAVAIHEELKNGSYTPVPDRNPDRFKPTPRITQNPKAQI